VVCCMGGVVEWGVGCVVFLVGVFLFVGVWLVVLVFGGVCCGVGGFFVSGVFVNCLGGVELFSGVVCVCLFFVVF